MKISNIFFYISLISLTACLTPMTPTFGLKPVYPLNECSRGNNPVIYFNEVDSLQPVLRWEAFPTEGMQPDVDQLSRIKDITYDLNIWSSESDSPDSLIYSRRGLPEPRHEMEVPLLTCSRYFWSVRARFCFDGRERVSEWGVSGQPWIWRDPSKVYESISLSFGNELVRRSPVVPHPNLYRFETRCPGKVDDPNNFGKP